MPPQQPYYAPVPPPQAPQQNRYDFIMNPEQPKRRGFGFGGFGANSLTKTLVFLVGGAVILMLVIGVAMRLIVGTGFDKQQMTTIAQTQQEIARVAELAAAKAPSNNVKNAAVTAQVTTTSQQKELLALLDTRGLKIKAKTLGLLKNSKTDTTLEEAAQTATYDTTYLDTLQTQLINYKKILGTAAGNTKSKTLKAELVESYNEVLILTEQAEQASKGV